MNSAVKVIFGLVALLVLLVALCTFSGALTSFFLKDEMALLQTQVEQTQGEIKAATGLEAAVKVNVEMRSGMKVVVARVTYPFIPPNADRVALYRAAEQSVHAHIKNLIGFSVTNIPDPGPQAVGGNPMVAVALPPPSAAAVAAVDAGAPAEPASTAKVAKGFLTLFTIPPGAAVTLEGKSLGPTPLLKKSLPAGTHLLKLAFPDGAKKKLSVKVEAGKNARFKLNESEVPAE